MDNKTLIADHQDRDQACFFRAERSSRSNKRVETNKQTDTISLLYKDYYGRSRHWPAIDLFDRT